MVLEVTWAKWCLMHKYMCECTRTHPEKLEFISTSIFSFFSLIGSVFPKSKRGIIQNVLPCSEWTWDFSGRGAYWTKISHMSVISQHINTLTSYSQVSAISNKISKGFRSYSGSYCFMNHGIIPSNGYHSPFRWFQKQ